MATIESTFWSFFKDLAVAWSSILYHCTSWCWRRISPPSIHLTLDLSTPERLSRSFCNSFAGARSESFPAKRPAHLIRCTLYPYLSSSSKLNLLSHLPFWHSALFLQSVIMWVAAVHCPWSIARNETNGVKQDNSTELTNVETHWRDQISL